MGKLTYMLHNYSLFKCAYHNWHSLGYLKKNRIHFDSLTYLNETYRIFNVATKNDSSRTTWFLDNLKKETPGSSCYENKKENCVKHGVLYKSFEKDLCPQGWSLPHQADWNSLFGIFGLNGTELKFFDSQPAGLYEKLSDHNYIEKYAFSGLLEKTGWWSFDNNDRLFAIIFNGKKFSHTYATEGGKYYVRCVKHSLSEPNKMN